VIGLFTPAGCRAARLRMLDGLAGRLDVRARLDVQDHVARCVACARELADLAAGQNAARRALGRYKRLRARVAPGRARLLSYRGTGVAGNAIVAFTRRAEALVGVAVLLLLIIGTTNGTPDVSSARLPAHRYVPTEHAGGLIRASIRTDTRIPVPDGMVIDDSALPEARGPVDRSRPGPQSQ
jgi:anti-sigma factor RsiW